MSYSLRPHGLQHAHQASLSFTIYQSLLKFMSNESVMLSNHEQYEKVLYIYFFKYLFILYIWLYQVLAEAHEL